MRALDKTRAGHARLQAQLSSLRPGQPGRVYQAGLRAAHPNDAHICSVAGFVMLLALTNDAGHGFADGVKTGYEKYSDTDKKTRWGLATGNCKNCEGEGWEKGYDGGWSTKIQHGVGVWGMELAKLLVEKHKIPVCIINGGSGSSTIEENMLFPEKSSLETSFGRLAYRVDQAGLKNGIKAIFYHQGESDSDKRYLSYADKFDRLNKDWKRVYKGLEKIYLFQTIVLIYIIILI